MEIPVIVEPVVGNGYRATGAGGLSTGLAAEGATEAEAMARLERLVQGRLAAGAQLRPLTVGVGPHPWSRYAGTLKGDPMLDVFKEAVEEYRRQRDADPDAP